MNSDIMAKAILDMKESIGKIDSNTHAIKEKVDSHDLLLKEHGSLLQEINHRTYNLDSWKNGIIHTITEEKEKALAEVRKEIEPLKTDYQNKKDTQKEIKNKFGSIIWGGVEKVSYIIVGYIITKINLLK